MSNKAPKKALCWSGLDKELSGRRPSRLTSLTWTVIPKKHPPGLPEISHLAEWDGWQPKEHNVSGCSCCRCRGIKRWKQRNQSKKAPLFLFSGFNTSTADCVLRWVSTLLQLSGLWSVESQTAWGCFLSSAPVTLNVLLSNSRYRGGVNCGGSQVTAGNFIL